MTFITKLSVLMVCATAASSSHAIMLCPAGFVAARQGVQVDDSAPAAVAAADARTLELERLLLAAANAMLSAERVARERRILARFEFFLPEQGAQEHMRQRSQTLQESLGCLSKGDCERCADQATQPH